MPSGWPTQDIIYTAIVGTVMLAAVLEWFLWAGAFLYCLFKVYRKAEHLSVQILAVIVATVFFLLRCLYLPLMVVTLPLPSQITRYFPEAMVSFLQWFGFWSFAGLLSIPWIFAIYQLITNELGRKLRVKEELDEKSAPKVVIVMPCFKEDPPVLAKAINSVVDCDYPPACIHVFLSFDGDQIDELYLKTLANLGIAIEKYEHFPLSLDILYRGARITISRFKHGGKRSCQKSTFKLIDKVYMEYLKHHDNLFILFIDSDCILDRTCLQNFLYDMELSPGNSRDMLAMTGVITATTEKNSFITLLQDMEYIHGQMFERTIESGCGSVTCLPGALTMLRFSAFRKMAKYYFADKAEQCEDLFDYGKCHLGEDRWLTHLFMIGAKKRYQIQMCTSAFCKTEAVQTYKSLIKQRRRWFLGFITNEVCMLTDLRIWRRYPLLTLIRFAQNTIRTTALLFFIMILAICTTAKSINQLPVGFIGVSLGLNWLVMIYYGWVLERKKVWLYPIMFVVNPFFNWYYMVYGIFTAGQRTWGGPRADAGAADAHTTPQEAIAKAEATGDELNVVPETFKPAVEAQKQLQDLATVPLQPPDRLEGRFVPATMRPDGLYEINNDSLLSFPGLGVPSPMPSPGLPPLHSRMSFVGSVRSDQSRTPSVYVPRRVETVMGEEDRLKYALAQARANRAVYVPERGTGRVYELSEDEESMAGFYSDIHEERPSHMRAVSYNSQSSQEGTAQPASRVTSPFLAVREPTRNRPRNGRSPLGVSSLRSAENAHHEYEEEIEMIDHPQSRETSTSPTSSLELKSKQ